MMDGYTANLDGMTVARLDIMRDIDSLEAIKEEDGELSVEDDERLETLTSINDQLGNWRHFDLTLINSRYWQTYIESRFEDVYDTVEDVISRNIDWQRRCQ